MNKESIFLGQSKFGQIVSLLDKEAVIPIHQFSYVKFIDFLNKVELFSKEYVKNRGNPKNDVIQAKLSL